MKLNLTVNGFADLVSFPDEEVAKVHLPILRHIQRLASDTKNTFIVLFAAPPGAGKSTITTFWAQLCRQDPSLTSMQPLSIDGFHYPNSYLQGHSIERQGEMLSLMAIKGAPETYNIRALCTSVEQLKQFGTATWPRYDRNIHDPVPDAIVVTAPIVVIEGNWVLLDEPNWASLRDRANLSIFLEADESLVRERLIRRKVRGGYALPEVEAHYERSDKPNIERVLSRRLPADITLRWKSDGQGERITLSNNVAQTDAKRDAI